MNLLKCSKQEKDKKPIKRKILKHNTHTPGEKQSEASLGSLILLPRLQVLFKSL